MKKSSMVTRLILIGLLVAVLSLGGVVSAFGAGDPVYGDELNPAQAAITKSLQMPEGTVTPGASFTFNIAKKAYNSIETTAALAGMPTIADKTVTFTATDAGTVATGVKTVKAETASLFSGIAFPTAGVYTYTITEVGGTYTIADATKESMTYSNGSYEVSVYVKDGAIAPYVYAIASTINTIDTDAQTLGDKVDPTPGELRITGDYSDMVFTNTYIKSHGGIDPTDPAQQALVISKNVSGEYANRELYFPFTVTLTRPALVSDPVTYKAYVVDGDDTVVTSADNGTGMLTDTHGGYFEFASGTSQTINLKHDQKLVFVDTHVGTIYTAVESAVADYFASVSVTVDGATPVVLTNPLDNTARTTQARILGENANTAAFVNAYKTVTPAGLDISNLPFYVLLAAGLAGLIALLIARRRDHERDEVVSA